MSPRFLRRTLIACLLTATLVPLPALADGPSAGDQQYVDPLAAATTPSPSASHRSTPAPAPAPAPATPAVPTAAPAAVPSPVAVDPVAATHALPYTGLDLPLLAACGAVLLAAGAGLRRAARLR